jgi:hypothetical protein
MSVLDRISKLNLTLPFSLIDIAYYDYESPRYLVMETKFIFFFVVLEFKTQGLVLLGR